MKTFCTNTALLILISISLLVTGRTGLAQPTPAKHDTVRVATPVSAHTFKEAVDVSVDNLGNVYVVDRGAHAIVKMPKGGSEVVVFGGPGSGGGQFYEPSDMDPTTGFLFIVADAGNARVQRLGTDFVYLESLSASASASSSIAHQFADDAVTLPDDLTPSAVSTTPDGSIYVLDGNAGRLLKWNQNRQLEAVTNLTSVESGKSDFIDMIAANARIYILDASQKVVATYDNFGNQLADLADQLTEPKSIVPLTQGLAVLDGKQIFAFTFSGDVAGVLSIHVDIDVIDFAVHRDNLYLLSPDKLYVAKLKTTQR